MIHKDITELARTSGHLTEGREPSSSINEKVWSQNLLDGECCGKRSYRFLMAKLADFVLSLAIFSNILSFATSERGALDPYGEKRGKNSVVYNIIAPSKEQNFYPKDKNASPSHNSAPTTTNMEEVNIFPEEAIEQMVTEKIDPYKFELPGITAEFLETLPGMSQDPNADDYDDEDDEKNSSGNNAGSPGGTGTTLTGNGTASTGNSTTPAVKQTGANGLTADQLIGTDFQPGRLVNIFFGLIFMMFMMVAQGYMMWVFGFAFLPGTRSLEDWHLEIDVLKDWLLLLIDALLYWIGK